jgi:hypothetical protein
VGGRTDCVVQPEAKKKATHSDFHILWMACVAAGPLAIDLVDYHIGSINQALAFFWREYARVDQ